MKSAENTPFGLWKSPFTAGARADRANFRDVRWDAGSGDLVWLERGSENTVLMIKPADGLPRILSDAYDIGGGVGYGGGDFDVRAGTVIFIDRGRQLIRLDVESGAAQPITPELGMLASPALSPDGRWITRPRSALWARWSWSFARCKPHSNRPEPPSIRTSKVSISL